MSVAESSRVDTEDGLAVIVPLYNEQPTVVELLARLISQKVVSQVIIVDDGSSDDSVPLVKDWLGTLPPETADRIVLLQHETNRGKGRAVRTGLESVACSHVIIQDADLEYDPADIAKLWTVMQSGEADVVYGSRYLDKPALQKGRWIMQSGVRFLNLLVRLLYGVKLTDEACCYKMFRTEDLRNMNLQCERFEFCPEVTVKALNAQLRIVEASVSYRCRDAKAGKKIGLIDGLRAIWTLGTSAPGSVRVKWVVSASVALAVLWMAIGYTRGENTLNSSFTVPTTVEVDASHCDSSVTLSIPIKNESANWISVFGIKPECSCVTVLHFPQKIAPGDVQCCTVALSSISRNDVRVAVDVFAGTNVIRNRRFSLLVAGCGSGNQIAGQPVPDPLFSGMSEE